MAGDTEAALTPAEYARLVALWPAAGILVCDADGRVDRISDPLQRLFALGGVPHALQGRPLQKALGADAATEWIAAGVRAISCGRAMYAVGYAFGRRVECVFLAYAGAPGMFAMVVLPTSIMAAWLSPMRGGSLMLSRTVADPRYALSEIELSVLRMISMGLGNSSIAARFSRTRRTVEWHTRNLLRKLGETTRIGLCRVACESGLHLFSDEHWELIIASRREDMRSAKALRSGRAPRG